MGLSEYRGLNWVKNVFFTSKTKIFSHHVMAIFLRKNANTLIFVFVQSEHVGRLTKILGWSPVKNRGDWFMAVWRQTGPANKTWENLPLKWTAKIEKWSNLAKRIFSVRIFTIKWSKSSNDKLPSGNQTSQRNISPCKNEFPWFSLIKPYQCQFRWFSHGFPMVSPCLHHQKPPFLVQLGGCWPPPRLQRDDPRRPCRGAPHRRPMPGWSPWKNLG